MKLILWGHHHPDTQTKDITQKKENYRSISLMNTKVQFSPSVMSNSLQSHGQQQASLPCPSLFLRAWLNSCPLSQWCHPTTSSSVVPFSSCLQSFQHQGLFPDVVCIRWPKYWSFSFSISPSSEYSGLISFRFAFFAVQGTLKGLQHHSSKASIPRCSAFFMVQLSHLYRTTGKNHSFN